MDDAVSGSRKEDGSGNDKEQGPVDTTGQVLEIGAAAEEAAK